MKIWMWTLRVHGSQKYANYGNYGEKGSFFLALFWFLHTRLGRGARDWGQMLTTLVILRTLRTLVLSLPLSHPRAFLSFFPSWLSNKRVIVKCYVNSSEVVPSFTTRLWHPFLTILFPPDPGSNWTSFAQTRSFTHSEPSWISIFIVLEVCRPP